MRLQAPMAVASAGVDGDVLAALSGADAWFSNERLRNMITHRSQDGIRRSLGRLVGEGIVEVEDTGQSHLFRLNRKHLAAPHIMALANLKALFLAALRDAFADWPLPPTYVAVFGSGARGEMRVDSDIDIFILRPQEADEAWDEALTVLMAEASRWTGNDVRALVLSEAEVKGRAAEEETLRAIVAEGIPVRGDRFAFKRLVGA